jgi:hypothetical protein
MPPEGINGIMDVTGTTGAPHLGGTGAGTSHCDMGVKQVATVKELTSGGYQLTVSGTELALLRSALDEAERVSRFGIEVLDGVDRSQDSESSEDSRLLREIDALAMREASLSWLQKAMAEVEGGGKLAPAQHADPG